MTDEDMAAVRTLFDGDLTIPDNFERTAPVYDSANPVRHLEQPATRVNPQTELLCTMLELTDPNAAFLGQNSSLLEDERSMNDSKTDDLSNIHSDSSNLNMTGDTNPDEISIADDDDDNDDDDVRDDVPPDDDVIIEAVRDVIDDEHRVKLTLPEPVLTSTPTRAEKPSSPSDSSHKLHLPPLKLAPLDQASPEPESREQAPLESEHREHALLELEPREHQPHLVNPWMTRLCRPYLCLLRAYS